MKSFLITLTALTALNATLANPFDTPGKRRPQAQRNVEQVQRQLESEHNQLDQRLTQPENSIHLAVLDQPEPPELPGVPDIDGIVAEAVEPALAAAGDTVVSVLGTPGRGSYTP